MIILGNSRRRSVKALGNMLGQSRGLVSPDDKHDHTAQHQNQANGVTDERSPHLRVNLFQKLVRCPGGAGAGS